MGTTNPYSIPYPEPGDPVRDGAANMRALAERVALIEGKRWANSYVGVRWGSTIVSLDGNGSAIIPISPAFDGGDIQAGMGSITIAMLGDAFNQQLIMGAHQPQQWAWQWTILCRTLANTLPSSGPYRFSWVGLGLVAM